MLPLHPKQTLAPANLQNTLLTLLPEIKELAIIDVIIPFNLDSSDVAIKEWQILADLIHTNMNKYDGFVIIHGTDTMVYTATALSFALQNLKKPVILTGAQRPLASLRTDARLNLIDAIEVATQPIGEVLIVFGQNVLRGNRSKKVSISNYDAFISPNYPSIGKIELNLDISHSAILNTDRDYKFDDAFDASLLSVHIFPGAKPAYYKSLLSQEDIRAFLLIGFGAGNIPVVEDEWISFIGNARKNGKSVVIGSSSAHGKVDLSLYAGGEKALNAGAIPSYDMTIEATIVKMMKVLAMEQPIDDFKINFERSIAGEISIDSSF